MTSRFIKKSRERDITHKRPKDQRREHMDKRLDRGLGALNKYNHHWEVDDWPRPPQHREVTPLNVSMVEILIAVQDKNLIQWPQLLWSYSKTQDLD